MPDALIGVDVGTTSTKALLFDLNGVELAAAQQGYPLDTPQPGWAEQNPDAVWDALVAVLRQLAAHAGSDYHIRAVALAVQCGSVIPTDDAGHPLAPMITWLDARTEALVAGWRQADLEPEVRRESGWLLHSGLPLPTIAWLQQHQSQLHSAAARYLSLNDFLTYRLTGRFVTNPSSAAEMQLLNISSGQWSNTLCDLAGISAGQLSPVEPAGAAIGPLTAAASRESGLPPDVQVINAGHDQCCAVLAMGMTDPGPLMLATGTAWVVTAITAMPDVDAAPPRMDVNFHVAPHRWTASQLLGSFGATIEWWLRHNLAPPPPAAPPEPATLFETFNRLAAGSKPSSSDLLFLPLSGSPQLADSRPGGGFVGLRLDHTRAEMARALLEGSAFEVRWALDEVRQAGLPVAELWLSGGATHSPLWPQILADVCQTPLIITRYANWPALGAAIIAGVGVEAFGWAEGIARFQVAGEEITPNPNHRALYDSRFGAYRRAAKAGVGGHMRQRKGQIYESAAIHPLPASPWQGEEQKPPPQKGGIEGGVSDR